MLPVSKHLILFCVCFLQGTNPHGVSWQLKSHSKPNQGWVLYFLILFGLSKAEQILGMGKRQSRWAEEVPPMGSLSQLDFQVTLKQGQKQKCWLTEQSWTQLEQLLCSSTKLNSNRKWPTKPLSSPLDGYGHRRSSEMPVNQRKWCSEAHSIYFWGKWQGMRNELSC